MQSSSNRRFRMYLRTALLCAIWVLVAQAVTAQGRHIFPEPGVASAQIRQALVRAKAEHKRVILDFGGDWCGDCQVLDIYLHDPANKPLLDANYVLVDVNVGHLDANQEIAAKYGVPLKRGVPALAVLDPNGKIVYAQANGEFEKMRTLQSSDLTKFLNDWKPTHGGARSGR